MGAIAVLIGLGVVGFVCVWFVGKIIEQQNFQTQKRQHDRFVYLSNRFGPEAANAIMAGQVWVGMPADMLLESKGRPVDTESKVLKTKSKETWKYQQFGKGRYALRVFLENGVVVGWDDKR